MLNVNEIKTLYLGAQGENKANPITIDVSPWLVSHPGGIVTIYHRRNGEQVLYPAVVDFDPEEGTICWNPSSADTYVAGEGHAEIRLYENGIIKKSREIITGVSPSITAGGAPAGSGWQDYIDALERAAGMAIIKDGYIKFAIDEASGHLYFYYTDEIPVHYDEEVEAENE